MMLIDVLGVEINGIVDGFLCFEVCFGCVMIEMEGKVGVGVDFMLVEVVGKFMFVDSDF